MAAWWRWCAERGLTPWPATPQDLTDYTNELTSLGLSPMSIQQRVRSVVGLAHERAGLENPARAIEVRRALMRSRNGRGATDPWLREDGTDFERRLTTLADGANRDRDVALLSLLRDARIEGCDLRALRWEDVTPSADGSGVLDLRHLGEHAELSARTMQRLAMSRNGARNNDPLFVNREHKPLSVIAVGRIVRSLAQPARDPAHATQPPVPQTPAPQLRRNAARRLLRLRIERDGWATNDLATALRIRHVLLRRWLSGSSTAPAYVGLALVSIDEQLPLTGPVAVSAEQLQRWISARQWTLASTARALGVSPSTVSMWLRGKVRLPTCLRLALNTIERRASERQSARSGPIP